MKKFFHIALSFFVALFFIFVSFGNVVSSAFHSEPWDDVSVDYLVEKFDVDVYHQYYFYFATSSHSSSGYPDYEAFVFFDKSAVSSDIVQIDENNIFNADFSNVSGMVVCYRSQGNGDNWIRNTSWNHLWLKFDVTRSFDAEDINSRYYLGFNDSMSNLGGNYVSFVYSNYDSIANLGNSSMSVNVSFSPSLSGSVDTYVTENNVTHKSKYFSMTVTNNTNKNIQYKMMIVSQGADNFHEIGLSNSDERFLDNRIKYVYLKKEWYYEFATNNNGYAWACGACCWHGCGAKSVSIQNFSWSQMQLDANTQYDVVVYAVQCANAVSLLSSENRNNLNSDYVVDWSNLREIYRSTFTLDSATNYNANDDSFGNIANKENDIIDYDTIDSFVSDGQTVVDKTSNKKIISNSYQDKSQYIYDDSSSGSGSGLGSDSSAELVSSTTSFFRFLNTALGFFPREFLAVFKFGLTALVAVAVVKLVIK